MSISNAHNINTYMFCIKKNGLYKLKWQVMTVDLSRALQQFTFELTKKLK